MRESSCREAGEGDRAKHGGGGCRRAARFELQQTNFGHGSGGCPLHRLRLSPSPVLGTGEDLVRVRLMAAYILRRLLLMIPTILGILFFTFVLTNFIPGGPVETMMAKIQGVGASEGGGSGMSSQYRGSQGFDPGIKAELEKQFGLDKPWYERFGKLGFGPIPISTSDVRPSPASRSRS